LTSVKITVFYYEMNLQPIQFYTEDGSNIFFRNVGKITVYSEHLDFSLELTIIKLAELFFD